MTASLLLTVPEVAAELRISLAQAWRLVGEGTIPSVRIGKSRRVRRVDLERWVEELAEGAA